MTTALLRAPRRRSSAHPPAATGTDNARGGARSTGVTAEVLAAHVAALFAGESPSVQRAALDELVRRRDDSRAEHITIAARPKAGVGRFVVVDADAALDVVVRSLDPPRGACACRDFATSSLGLCAHVLLAVSDALRRYPRRATPLAPPPIRCEPSPSASDPLAAVVCDRRAPLPPSLRTRDGRLRVDARAMNDPSARARIVDQLAAASAASRRDPALAALIVDERRRAGAAKARHRDGAAVLRASAGLRRALYPHQRAAVARLVSEGCLLLADDMGLGKTTQAAAAAHVLVRLGLVSRAIVVVPASLKDQWRREWADTTDVPLRVVEGTRAQRMDVYACNGDAILLVHYEQLARDADAIVAFGADLVVLDEAQRIKNARTKTAAAALRLSVAPFRLAMTGTPVENRLDELVALLAFVDDRALAPSWRVVADHVVRDEATKQQIGVRGLDALRARMQRVVLRRRRADVAADLPPRTDHRIAVGLTPAQREQHLAHDAPIARLVGAAKKRPLRREEFLSLMSHLTKQRIACDGAALYDFSDAWPRVRGRAPSLTAVQALDAPKLVALRALLRRLVVDEGRKVVVFSQWRRMLSLAEWAVRDVLAEAGARGAFFSGDEARPRRAQNVVDFHEAGDVRVLFATDAGGVGLNLQRAADAVVCLDLPWNPAVVEQRVARVHRPGQRRPVDAYFLVADEGIEARIATLVQDKAALFAAMFDGCADEVRFQRAAGFMRQVQQLVEPTPAAAAVVAPPAPPEVARGEVARLVNGIALERRADGSVALVVAADVAGMFEALVRGLAGQLRPQASSL